MTTVLILAAWVLLIALLLRWMWPRRKGRIAAGADDPEALDRKLEEVGNLDLPRQPGEEGIGSGGMHSV